MTPRSACGLFLVISLSATPGLAAAQTRPPQEPSRDSGSSGASVDVGAVIGGISWLAKKAREAEAKKKEEADRRKREEEAAARKAEADAAAARAEPAATAPEPSASPEPTRPAAAALAPAAAAATASTPPAPERAPPSVRQVAPRPASLPPQPTAPSPASVPAPVAPPVTAALPPPVIVAPPPKASPAPPPWLTLPQLTLPTDSRILAALALLGLLVAGLLAWLVRRYTPWGAPTVGVRVSLDPGTVTMTPLAGAGR